MLNICLWRAVGNGHFYSSWLPLIVATGRPCRMTVVLGVSSLLAEKASECDKCFVMAHQGYLLVMNTLLIIPCCSFVWRGYSLLFRFWAVVRVRGDAQRAQPPGGDLAIAKGRHNMAQLDGAASLHI